METTEWTARDTAFLSVLSGLALLGISIFAVDWRAAKTVKSKRALLGKTMTLVQVCGALLGGIAFILGFLVVGASLSFIAYALMIAEFVGASGQLTRVQVARVAAAFSVTAALVLGTITVWAFGQTFALMHRQIEIADMQREHTKLVADGVNDIRDVIKALMHENELMAAQIKTQAERIALLEQRSLQR